MGFELAESDPVAKDTFLEADRILGFSLSEICWEGPAEILNDTINTQPALFTHSIAVLRAIQEKVPSFKPQFTAGHSLGEYTALVAGGALSFSDGLKLVRERGRLMKDAGDRHPGGMVAVLGLDIKDVEEICHRISTEDGSPVWVANDNCPGQVVISGGEEGLTHAIEQLTDAGARKVVRLAVSIAAHSPLMTPAQEKLNEFLNRIPIHSPELTVVGNVHAAEITTADEVRADLTAQLTSRVRWRETIKNLIDSGVDAFYELGSGNVLTGLMRRIDRSVPASALDSPSTIASLAETQNSGR